MIYWLIIGSVDFIFTVISYFLAIFVAFFVDSNYMLPKWLSWFQTPDALMNGKGTITDDNGSVSGGDWNFYQQHKNDSKYLTSLLWMWRNPIGGFSSTVSSKKLNGKDFMLLGNALTNNRAPHAVEGWYLIIPKNWKSVFIFSAWEFYWVKAYSPNKCLRIKLGWKCANAYFSCSTQYAKCVHSINPIMGYND